MLQHSDAEPLHSDLSLLAPSHVAAEQPVELSESPSNADINQPILSEPFPQPPAPRKSIRTRRQPRFLRDFHCQLAIGLAAPIAPQISRSTHSGNPYGLSSVHTYHRLSPTYQLFALTISSDVEPKRFHEALNFTQWKEAMVAEISALEANNTWTLVELPPGKTLVACKWFFKLKYNPNSQAHLYKARLVAKGFTKEKASITLKPSLRLPNSCKQLVSLLIRHQQCLSLWRIKGRGVHAPSTRICS